MDALDLKTFGAVARTGGIGRAAGPLRTVQSNVSTRIQRLEEDLGVTLFHRHHQGVTLTAAGNRLLPYVERIEHLLAEARRVTVDDGAPRGPLAIGSMETTAAVRLPPLLIDFAAAFPHVDLALTTGPTGALITNVLARRLDGALVAGPVRHVDLEAEPVFREELVLVTLPTLKRPGDLDSSERLTLIVFRAGCSYRRRLETLLADRGPAGLRWLEFGTLEGILGCVAAGLGVSLLPRSVAADAERAGRVAVHELPDRRGHVDTVFIRRRDTPPSSALTAFLQCAHCSARHQQVGIGDDGSGGGC